MSDVKTTSEGAVARLREVGDIKRPAEFGGGYSDYSRDIRAVLDELEAVKRERDRLRPLAHAAKWALERAAELPGPINYEIIYADINERGSGGHPLTESDLRAAGALLSTLPDKETADNG